MMAFVMMHLIFLTMLIQLSICDKNCAKAKIKKKGRTIVQILEENAQLVTLDDGSICGVANIFSLEFGYFICFETKYLYII